MLLFCFVLVFKMGDNASCLHANRDGTSNLGVIDDAKERMIITRTEFLGRKEELRLSAKVERSILQ